MFEHTIKINNNASKTSEEMLKLVKALEKNLEATRKAETGFNKLSKTISTTSSAISQLGKIAAASLTFKGIADATTRYNKSLFDLSQTSKFTTQSFAQMQKAINEIGASTRLTMKESAQLVTVLQNQKVGLKLNSAELINIAKAMDVTYASTEDITNATRQLVDLQSKDIDIVKKLNSGMSDTQLIQYADGLKYLRGATEDQRREVINLGRAMRDGAGATTAEQKKNRALADSVRELQKVGEDLLITWGQPLADTFAGINTILKDIVGTLHSVPPWVLKAGLVGSIGIGAVSVAGMAYKGIKGVMGKGGIGGDVLGGLGVGGGSRDGSSAEKALFVQQAGGAGAIGDAAGSALSGGGGVVNTVKSWASKLAPVYIAAAAAGGLSIMASDQAFNENVKGRANTGAMGLATSAAYNVVNPYQGGKDIVTAAILLKDAAKEFFTGGEKRTGAAALSGGAFKQRIQEMQRQNGASEVLQQADKQSSVTTDISEKLVAQKEIYEEIAGRVAGIAKQNEAILGPQQKQLDYLQKYTFNIADAVSLNAKMVDRLRSEVEERQKIIEQLKKEEELTGINENITQKRAAALAEIAERETQIAEAALRVAKFKDETVAVKELEIGNLEAELNLTKSIYAGLGPQLDVLSQMNDKLEEAKSLYASQLRDVREELKTKKDNPQLMKQALELQNKLTSATQKQVDLTKNLREGYLDAMGAFTNVEGSFAKIITRNDQNLGAMLRMSGQSGSLRGGGLGGGMTTPYAKFSPGGQLEMTGKDQMDRLMNARGLGQIGKPMVSAMSGFGGLKPDQQSAVLAGQSSGLITGAGAAADDPIAQLNKDMPQRVAEGIKMAGSGGVAPVIKEAAAAAKKGAGKNFPSSMAFSDPTAKMSPEMAGMERRANAEIMGIQAAINANPVGGRNLTNVNIGNMRGGNPNAAGGPKIAAAVAAVQKKVRTPEMMRLDGEIGGLAGERRHIMAQMKDASAEGRSFSGAELQKSSERINTIDREMANKKALLSAVERTAKNTEKGAKSSEQTAKHIERSAADQKRSENTGQSLGAALGFGGGPLGLMGNGSPADFGMKKMMDSMGYGTGDNFGAGLFGMAGGGKVPGSGNGDTVPALLTPGERVIKQSVSRRFGPLLDAMNANRFANGGIVGPAPSFGGGMSGMPNISLNVRGDSVNKMMKATTGVLYSTLNRMMTPSGTTGRQFEQSTG